MAGARPWASRRYRGLPKKTRVGRSTGLFGGAGGAPAASQAVQGWYVLLRFNGARSEGARVAPHGHAGSSRVFPAPSHSGHRHWSLTALGTHPLGSTESAPVRPEACRVWVAGRHTRERLRFRGGRGMSGFEAWNEFNKRFRMILDSEISFSPPLRAPSVTSVCAHCG